MQWIRQFQADESGQDIIEYSLLICFIAIACMFMVGAGGPAVNAIWTSANTRMTTANGIATNGGVSN
jgi:Flp pilus assembly pilin Flp